MMAMASKLKIILFIREVRKPFAPERNAKIRINTLMVLQSFTTARKSGSIFRHSEKLFPLDTHQSMKLWIATER